MGEHPVHLKRGSPAAAGPEQHHGKKASPTGRGPAHHYVLRNLRASGPWLRGLCIAAVVLGSVAPARAGELTIRQIGAWGGSVDAVFVEQNGDQTLAYVGSGVNLVIVDVTDPANVIELGRAMFEGIVLDVKVRGGYAFVASELPGWFSVVDVSDPRAPIVVSEKNDSRWSIGWNRVWPYGDTAFLVGRGGAAVECYNIADPEHPVFEDPDCIHYWNTDAAVVSGDYMFLAGEGTRDDNVAVADLSTWDPSANSGGVPQAEIVGTTSIPDLWMGFSASPPFCALNGDMLYIAHRLTRDGPNYSRIYVVDFSNLEAPSVVGTWGEAEGEHLLWPVGMAVSEGKLYVVDWAFFPVYDPRSAEPNRALAIFDITMTDPTRPLLLGEYWMVGAARGVTVIGTRAYLHDERHGLIVLDCSDPANITPLGGYLSPGVFQQGVLSENMLYLTDGRYGVTMVDVSDPRSPTLRGAWDTQSSYNWGIAVRHGLAYVAAGWSGVQILDVADPAAPSRLGQFELTSCGEVLEAAVGLELDGDMVHLGTECDPTDPRVSAITLTNLDVGDPGNIKQIGMAGVQAGRPPHVITTKTITNDEGFEEVFTFAARYQQTTFVFNNTVPGEPSFVPLEQYGYWIRDDLCFVDGLLYTSEDRITEPEHGLYIYDVSDPARWLIEGRYLLPPPSDQNGHAGEYNWSSALTVDVERHRAYLGLRDGYLRAIDVSDPGSPVPLHAVPHGGPLAHYRDLILDPPYLYAATFDKHEVAAGVLMYQVFYPGDGDDDADVDLRDYATLQRCYSGGAPLPAGRAGADCLVFDFEEDDDLDLGDFGAFTDALTGPVTSPGGPTGACCLPDGTCTDGVTAAHCTWHLGGQYQGDATTCDTSVCAPTGACCLAYGSEICVEQTEFACLDDGGTYQGDYTTCETATCPFGACCEPSDGTCTEKTPTACTGAGGSYQGDGTTCVLIDCPFGQYSNEIDPMTDVALAGAGLQIADDMTLEGTGARELV
ncbi:MAG: hypothetical protein JSU86_12220, partial [Phycisphaerales bacterium]